MNNLGIKEIAKLAEVSIGTVDRVLHNRLGVSPKTKEKVLKIIEETGFKKNVIASRLKLASKKKIKIAVLFPEVRNKLSYWNLPKKGIKKAKKELIEQGISIKYFYFNIIEPKTFTEQSSLILSEDFDAIISVPFLKDESQEMFNHATKKNMIVVFLDTKMDFSKSNDICQNSFNAGVVAGRLLHGLVGNAGHYFVVNLLNADRVQVNNREREWGFRSFFNKNYKNASLKIHTINHSLKDKFELTPELRKLFSSKKSKGMFVANSRSFLIPQILQENNINDIKIIGFDLNHLNISYLKSGEINFLINQKPEFQGYAAVKGIYKYFTENDDSELNMDIPVEIIVKENYHTELY